MHCTRARSATTKSSMLTRRQLLSTATLAAAARALRAASPAPSRLQALPAAFAHLEQQNRARLGVAVLDTGTGETATYRPDERFPMCSTVKLLVAAAILQRADTNGKRGRQTPDQTPGHSLDQPLPIPAPPLVSHSPLTEPHAGGQMTIRDLLHAILTESDNTATNVLLASLGGPASITQFARSLGDPITRLDRTETALNESIPGDPRDTTSPAAMLADMQKIVLGPAGNPVANPVLTPASRAQLTSWMVENKYGETRLRANLPPLWRAADKTGSNGETTSNDIAVLWPPHQPPILITAYLTSCPGPETRRGAILAEVGRLITSVLQPA